MKKGFIAGLLLLTMIVLSSCGGKEKAVNALNEQIGSISFSDESILTAEEKAKLADLQQRQSAAVAGKDLNALEAVRADWEAFKTPIETFIKNYNDFKAGFLSDKSLLTESEKKWFEDTENAAAAAYRERNAEELQKVQDKYNAAAPKALRQLISDYKAIDQKPFSEIELVLMSAEERTKYQALIDDTNEALLARDSSAMSSLKSQWSSFPKTVKSNTDKAKDNMIQDWIKGANLGSSLTGLFSMGMIEESTSVQGHKIVQTTKYNSEYMSDSQIETEMKSFFSLLSSTYQSGADYLGGYISDIVIRFEFQNYKGKTVCSKEFKPQNPAKIVSSWQPSFPTDLIPGKGMNLDGGSSPVAESTTAALTTAVPTTAAPTTAAPTTAVPTTAAPTAEAPTTEAPTTEAPTTEALTTEAPTTPPPADLHVGEIVTFGYYEQDNNLNNGAEPIEWMVMGVFDDYVDLISLYVLDVIPYNSISAPVTYSGSSVNAYLNDTFFRNAFSEEERSYMMTHNIPPRSNPEYPGTDQGLEVTEYVFLSAVGKVTEFLPTDIARRCAGTPYAVARGLHVNEMGFSPWWTRTMGGDNYHAVIVRSSGEVFYEGWDVTGADYFDIGIRPAIRVQPYAPLGD